LHFVDSTTVIEPLTRYKFPNYTVHDVARDGDCLFHALSHQVVIKKLCFTKVNSFSAEKAADRFHQEQRRTEESYLRKTS